MRQIFQKFRCKIFKTNSWPSPAPPTWNALSTLYNICGLGSCLFPTSQIVMFKSPNLPLCLQIYPPSAASLNLVSKQMDVDIYSDDGSTKIDVSGMKINIQIILGRMQSKTLPPSISLSLLLHLTSFAFLSISLSLCLSVSLFLSSLLSLNS